MADQNELNPGQQIKAVIDIYEVMNLLKTYYGFVANTIVELDAYDDRNYRVMLPENANPNNPYFTSYSKEGYIFKIINSLDSKNTEFYDAQTKLLIYLMNQNVVCPAPIKMKDGSFFTTVTLQSGTRHIIRLLVYQPGEILGKVKVSATLLHNLGLFVGALNVTLRSFSHPGYDNRTSLWVLEKVPKLRDFVFALKDKVEKNLVEEIIQEFEDKVLPIYQSLERGIIHGDLNESNILVNQDGSDIAAIIDFGDSHKNCYVFELAVCLCYMITKVQDIGMAKHVIDGYMNIRPLTSTEREILKLCVCARFAQSLTLGAYSYSMEPNNKYLVRDVDVKWKLLNDLWRMRNHTVMQKWGITENSEDIV